MSIEAPEEIIFNSRLIADKMFWIRRLSGELETRISSSISSGRRLTLLTWVEWSSKSTATSTCDSHA